MKKLFILGDSVAFGQFVSPHLTWPTLVAGFCDSIPMLVQVTARNGETTRQALLRYEFDVLSHKPDYVWIQYGINDANFWPTEDNNPRVSPSAFHANLHELVSRALDRGAFVILATNHPVLRVRMSPNGLAALSENVEAYNSIVLRVFEAFGGKTSSRVALFNYSDLANSTDDFRDGGLLPDGVHLSSAGHRLYADAAIEALSTLLKCSGAPSGTALGR